MNSPKRAAWVDVIILLLLTMSIAALVIVTQHTQHINTVDAGWYTNRAQLIWRDIWNEAYVYTVLYPILVGAVNLALHELVASSLLVNTIMLFLMLVGVYWLGLKLFSRFSGLVAATSLALNPELLIVIREVQPPVTFMFMVVWGLIAYFLLVDHPSIVRSALAGSIYTMALYTRFEGSIFSILLLLAAFQIYRKTNDIRYTLRIFVVGFSIFTVGAIYYLWVLSATIDEGGAFYSVLHPFLEHPVNVEHASWRITATLHSIFYHWPPIVWLAIFVMIILRPGRWAVTCYFIAGLIVYYGLSVYILTLFPFPSKAMFSMPFMALLVGLLVWRVKCLNRVGPPLASLLLILLLLPSVPIVANFAKTLPFAYRNDPLAEQARDVDAWLESQGLQDTSIMTFCDSFTPYTNSNFRLLYRLNNADVHRKDRADSPLNLLPEMKQSGQLYMQCSGNIRISGTYYQDWIDYLRDLEQQPYQFEEIGRVHQFVFYRVIEHES